MKANIPATRITVLSILTQSASDREAVSFSQLKKKKKKNVSVPLRVFHVNYFRLHKLSLGWRGGGLLSCRGSMVVSGKLPTYSSPKLTFFPKKEVSFNVKLGKGKVGSLPETTIDPLTSCIRQYQSRNDIRNVKVSPLSLPFLFLTYQQLLHE